MFYFPDRHNAVPGSPMAVEYMETLICDASAMTYCFCIPRDMNHPISDNFNNNTFYAMFTHQRFKKYLSLVTIIWKPALNGTFHVIFMKCYLKCSIRLAMA